MLTATARVEAQTPTKHIAVGFGAGHSVGIGTDASDPKPTFAGSVWFDVSRHVAFEAEVTHLGSSSDVVTGPGRFSGTVSGQYTSVATHQSSSTWTSAFDVFAHTNGRLSVFGGGGFGLGVTHNDYIVSFTGCSASDPRTCAGYSLPRDGSGLTLNMAGRVEGRITDRFSAFGSVQVQGAYLYGPTALRGLAGLRVRLR